MVPNQLKNKAVKRKYVSVEKPNTLGLSCSNKRSATDKMTRSSKHQLMDLPPELILKVLESLSPNDLKSLRCCSMTCKTLRTMVSTILHGHVWLSYG